MSRPDLAGTTLAGRYKIFSVIGEGGMGSVYLGEQIAMGRRTAIKVLHSGADDADAIARFRRGSRNAARIDHPNVCRIFEYGDPPGGLHFLAMEYIDGESLHDVISLSPGGRIPLLRATRITGQVLAALEAAHRLGIVHRDLKPANIMLTRAPTGEELVKVVDFDIAKAPADPGDRDITQMHWWVGTPVYMSPEQLLHKPLDARSDIYSLGIVFYRAVTGTLPFSATNHWAIMAQRLDTDPMPLQAAAPELSFPEGLQGVVDRALHREPAERWSTAAEFREALEAVVAGTAGGQRPPLADQPPDISSLPTEPWKGDWVAPSRPSAPSRPRHGAVPDDLDPSIPATELATPTAGQFHDRKAQAAATRIDPFEPPAPSGPSRRVRLLATAGTLVAIAIGAWGAARSLDLGNASVIGSNPEEELLTIQQGLLSLDLAGGEPPAGLVESADSTARFVFEQYPGRPELQARAASVASQARSYLNDWQGAFSWAERAVDLAPTDAAYQTTLARAARERLAELDRTLRSDGGAVTPDLTRTADSVAAFVFGLGWMLTDVRARAASVRATTRAGSGDLSGAVGWAQQAVELAPNDPSYRAALTAYRERLEPGGPSGGTTSPAPLERQPEDAGPTSVASPDPADQLAALESELRSAGNGLSDSRAAAIDNAARLLYDQNGESRVLQARAASVRAQALVQMGDWGRAVTWAQSALSLDTDRHRSTADSVYARSVRGFDSELNNRQALLSTSVPEDLIEAAGDLARRVYEDVEAKASVRASAADLRATALVLRDDPAGAAEWVRHAMALDPGNTYYPRRLQVIGGNRQ